MLEKDPSKRPSAEEILEHPWLTSLSPTIPDFDQRLMMGGSRKKRGSILANATDNLLRRKLSKINGNLNIG